jgi:hypothetical protein
VRNDALKVIDDDDFRSTLEAAVTGTYRLEPDLANQAMNPWNGGRIILDRGATRKPLSTPEHRA